MKKSRILLISFILFLIGTGVFIFKTAVLNFPLVPNTKTDTWDIEMRISFTPSKKASKIQLYIPSKSYNYAVMSENFISGKYGLITDNDRPNRRAIWSARRVRGKQNLYYQAKIQKLINGERKRVLIRKPKGAPPIKLKEPYLSAARILWAGVYEKSADLDTIVGNIFSFLHNPNGNENIRLFLKNGASTTISSKIKTAVQLLSIGGINAHSVHGFDLDNKAQRIRTVHWIEVFHNNRWNRYNPYDGRKGIPDSYIAWWRGSKKLYSVKGAKTYKIDISAQVDEEEAIKGAIKKSKISAFSFYKFSLLNLPVQNQKVFRVIFLIPIGAFLVVIFRNLIGLKTFGTFMPVLIAISFRETDLLWGILLFSLIVALGLSVRFFLEKLKLLVVPRLTAVLIAVILIIAILNIITHNLGFSLGLSVSLFPIVILAMTIERMSIIWDERGPLEAFIQGGGTLLVSTAIFFVINIKAVEHLVFIFPELLLIVLSITLILGRYSGFRLIEIYRFKELSRKDI